MRSGSELTTIAYVFFFEILNLDLMCIEWLFVLREGFWIGGGGSKGECTTIAEMGIKERVFGGSTDPEDAAVSQL